MIVNFETQTKPLIMVNLLPKGKGCVFACRVNPCIGISAQLLQQVCFLPFVTKASVLLVYK